MKRSHYIYIFALASLVATGCSPMRSTETHPLNTLARWSGFGFSDGYHRCPMPCRPMLANNACSSCTQPGMPMQCPQPAVMPAGYYSGPVPRPGQSYYAPGYNGEPSYHGMQTHQENSPAESVTESILENPKSSSEMLLEPSDTGIDKPSDKPADVKLPEANVDPSPSDLSAPQLIPPQARFQMIAPGPVVYRYGPIPKQGNVVPSFPVYGAFNYAPAPMMARPQIR